MAVLRLDELATSVPTRVHRLEMLGFATHDYGSWIVVTASGDVDNAATLVFQGVLVEALERGQGWLIVDLTATTSFEVLPLAVLAKIRARALAVGGQLRLIVDPASAGVLVELDRGRWNISSDFAGATRWPAPRLRQVPAHSDSDATRSGLRGWIRRRPDSK
jgi:anti-anti-sigma regulatory factor